MNVIVFASRKGGSGKSTLAAHLAAQIKARLIVCHLGSVMFFWFNPGVKIRDYVEAHRGFNPAEP